TEFCRAVGLRPGGDVGEEYRNRLGQLDVQSLAGGNNLLHAPWAIPAWLVTRDPFNKLEHALHTHTAGAESTPRLVKERLHRRVVHIDDVLVRHIDAHEAEGILRPRILTELDPAHVSVAPVDAVWVELRTVPAIESADELLLQIIRLLDEPGDEVELGHTVRHMP